MDALKQILAEHPGYKVLGRAKLKLVLKGKVSAAIVDQYIDSSELHQVHARAPVKDKEFLRITGGQNEFQIDVVVFPKFKSSNGGKDRFLLIEDILSRKAWAYVIPSNKMADVLTAYRKFVSELGNRLISVEGDDFFASKDFLEFNEQKGIRVSTVVAADDHMVRGGGDKLGLIDRLCRTLKDILNKLVLSKGSTKWAGFLHEAIDLYNSTPHSSLHNKSPDQAYNDPELLGQKMADDRKHNEALKASKSSRSRFAVGDSVRIRLPTTTFGKEGASYSTELYTVSSVAGNKFHVINADTGVELKRALRPSEMRKFAAVHASIKSAKGKAKAVEAVSTHARKLAKESIVAEPLKAAIRSANPPTRVTRSKGLATDSRVTRKSARLVK